MATLAGQRTALKFDLRTFERNIERMKRETLDEVNSVLLTGASAYATSASKHTPPSLGKPELDPIYYVNGVWVRNAQEEREPKKGRRQVFDLVAMARDERAKFRSFYGEMARKGYRYMVKIIRPKRRIIQKFCRDLSEAERYAYESYRGLMRAAWGLGLDTITGKVPPAFRKYLSARPQLANLARLNDVTMDADRHEVTLVNNAIPTGSAFLTSTDVNAQIAAARSMNDRMNKFFKKKFEL